jgi:hypothetical protein
MMMLISINIEKGKVISIGRLKILIGLASKNKPLPKQCDIHGVVDSACLCEQNARGQVVSGWCRKHHTDWM